MPAFCSSPLLFKDHRNGLRLLRCKTPHYSLTAPRCSLRPHLEKLSIQADLSEKEITEAVSYAVSEQSNDCEVAAFLALLAAKGETVVEISAIASYMRSRMIPVKANGKVLEIVGTGGDGADTVNISTAASIVAAAAGCIVGKHGNRSGSSKCGSADVLEELGINLELSPEEVTECIDEAGIGFMYAPNHHPCLKRVARVRKALKIRTVFNTMGPLLNPAAAEYGIIGVFPEKYLDVFANVLSRLGMKRALVVHTEGLDELSNTGVASIVEIGGRLKEVRALDPTSIGIQRCELAELKGGDAGENARILREILAGNSTRALREAVALNAGAGCYIYGLEPSIEAGVDRAKRVIESGEGLRKLEQWKTISQRKVYTVR
eukprot:Plantae.Rhodophyta-Hildenbrandia_rubra.ctg17393.p1 GENE.Plantae.Rhodophyta-Hildenbrandia_rubra.ctg17393~~Plantae.Rhodophyta-Hildenbrandia_rubra.ctg17393.p1  ORF type:complete len:377 (-),score=70.60 Plantae.Rhodophyta-Hildenbrandia_rubra.ctg17393:1539-2669(-)